MRQVESFYDRTDYMAVSTNWGSLSLGVQVLDHKVSTQNQNYDSECKNPTYPIVGYFGPLGFCWCPDNERPTTWGLHQGR